jgi:3D-(3,5/4)-trihydroxycyclohexane-1,2-dione acylhydrolase (decyclizing)
MGYEIAGGLGVKLALPEREVWVLVGDGSYLMMNSEIATSITLGKKLNIVLLDNGGFGCIDRLQRVCGIASFNNLFPDGSGVDFVAHAESLGADSCKVASIAELESALSEMRAARAPRSLSSQPIRLSAPASVPLGGTWPIPEVVQPARSCCGSCYLRRHPSATPDPGLISGICATQIANVVTA